MEVFNDVSRYCSHSDGFGDVLERIRRSRKMTQADLGKVIARGKAETSRWLNNDIPRYLRLSDVEKIALDLGCSREEFAELVRSYVCYVLAIYEIVDVDVL